MGKFKNIPWSAKEYKMLQVAVQSFPDLQSLLDKMDAARNKAERPRQAFGATDAINVAKLVLGSRLKLNPIMNVAWYGKMNKFLLASGLDAALFKKAATLAKQTWKGKVYFDTLVFSAAKLIALNSPNARRDAFTGFAGGDLMEVQMEEE